MSKHHCACVGCDSCDWWLWFFLRCVFTLAFITITITITITTIAPSDAQALARVLGRVGFQSKLETLDLR